jgi:UDP-glucose 4-epimerase
MRMLITNEGPIGPQLAARAVSRGDEVRLGASSEAAVRWADTVVHPIDPCSAVWPGVVGTDTHELMDACVAHDRRLFVVSNSAAYGRGHRVELAEDDACVAYPGRDAGWAAAVTTLAAERVALSRMQEGLRVVVGRLFNVVSPSRRSALRSLVRQAVSGEAITVHGDGRQLRAFLHARDAAKAFLAVIDARPPAGEIVNIGACSAVPMIRAARRIKQLTRARGPILRMLSEDGPHRRLDQLRTRLPHLDKLERLIGYRPCSNLDTLLLEIIQNSG